MTSYQFFKLLTLNLDEPLELRLLKSRYNALASRLNTKWPILTDSERVEMSTNLKALEDEIKKHLRNYE
jgi:hypothetical protein